MKMTKHGLWTVPFPVEFFFFINLKGKLLLSLHTVSVPSIQQSLQRARSALGVPVKCLSHTEKAAQREEDQEGL